MKRISQAEAHRLKRRVRELEEALGGRGRSVSLGSIEMGERSWLVGRLEGARLLDHPVMVTSIDGKKIFLAALRITC
jgi:hypothetical protein